MKIAVIGKGTASIITTLMLLKNGHEVSIFFDPATPHINVGESTTPHIHELIKTVLGLNLHDLVNEKICSYKAGVNFVNWGNTSCFKHSFVDGGFAFHFETQFLNPFIHGLLEENKFVKYFEERVTKIIPTELEVLVNGKRFDFLVNCAGWEEKDKYLTPIIETVNSVVLYKKELGEIIDYTEHLATEDGWQFGLPFPDQKIMKCGYLYNNILISEEEVKKKLNVNAKNSFSWKPRFAKELLIHPRIALNGNRLFFIEPLQALSLLYTHDFAEYICQYLNNFSTESVQDVNVSYHYAMWTYQLSLAYHYSFGSAYESKFWNKTTKQAKEVMAKIMNGNQDIFEMNLKIDKQRKTTEYSKIGKFGLNDHQYLYAGLSGVDLNKLLMT